MAAPCLTGTSRRFWYAATAASASRTRTHPALRYPSGTFTQSAGSSLWSSLKKDDHNEDPADWVKVPEGYRSAGWVRVREAEAAVAAYQNRRDVPVRQGAAITGWAHYEPNWHNDRKVRLVRVRGDRTRQVCRIAENEAAAVVQAERR